MRLSYRTTLLALATGVASQTLGAQDTTRAAPPAAPPGQQPRTHTVVRGDNLWDLSQRYLGNPFLWPEIYRLNRDVVEDPHWIYPGEILRLPGPEEPATVVVVVPPPGDTSQAVVTTRPAAPLDPTSGETVFTRRYATAPQAPNGVRPNTGTGVLNVADKTTVRAGEVLAAPYVDREGGPRGFGRILKSAELTGVAEASERFRFQAFDAIYISPPVGYVAPEGERYLAVKLGPIIHDQGQIVIPTGVIEVTAPARAGRAATGKVVRSFVAVSVEDLLIPIDTAGVGTTVAPLPVENGPSTKIQWIYNQPVLPSVGHYVILNVSARNGVRMGDEFTIYKPSEKSDDRAPIDPEVLISKMQVVRSTLYGVTAVIVGQQQPGIREGMNARITAKMP